MRPTAGLSVFGWATCMTWQGRWMDIH